MNSQQPKPLPPAHRLQNSLDAMRRARSMSQADAMRAIESMLAALRGALGDERMAGMPNLGTSSAPFYAACVRAKAGSHARVPTNFDPNKPTLVLTDRGELVMAHEGASDGWQMAPAEASVLRANDPEKLANTIVECIEAHCRRADKSTRRFERLANFSRRLWEVCEYEEN